MWNSAEILHRSGDPNCSMGVSPMGYGREAQATREDFSRAGHFQFTRRLTRVAFLIICTGSLASLCLADAAPTTEPSLQTLKQEEYARQLTQYAAITNSRVMHLSDLVHIHLRDGRITFQTPVKSDWLRVGLGNPLLLCTLTQRAPGFVHLTLDDFTNPADVFMQAEILAVPGQMQIVGSWEGVHDDRIVTLIDKDAEIDEQGRKTPGQTRLIVQENSDSGGATVNFTLAAPDWPTLARQHPQEVRKYLRPVLGALHDDTILQPDPRVEWQIFGPRATPDPAASEAVQKILPLLDSESFSQRQSALRQLLALKTNGAIALMRIDPRQLSPEQSARIADVLLPYHQLSPREATALSRQPEFLLDCMNSDDVQLRRLAAEQLAGVLKHAVDFDPQAPAQQRDAQLAKLRRTLLNDE